MATPLAKGGTFNWGSITQTAGTKIRRLIWPKSGFRTIIKGIRYNSGSTAHTLTVLRPIGETTLTAAAAASQAVVSIAADPGAVAQMRSPSGSTSRVAANALAANDNACLQLPDGTYITDLVSSVSSLDITMTTNLPTNGMASGAKFWNFGVEADTEPWAAAAHATFKPPASAITTFFDEDGIFCSGAKNQPLLIISDNATAAGVIDAVWGIYAP